jgi:hypothetical protein
MPLVCLNGSNLSGYQLYIWYLLQSVHYSCIIETPRILKEHHDEHWHGENKIHQCMMQIIQPSTLFHMTVYLEVNTNDITSIILQTNMYRNFSHCGFNWAIPFNMCTPPPPPSHPYWRVWISNWRGGVFILNFPRDLKKMAKIRCFMCGDFLFGNPNCI